ncbi:MAG: TonB-dependent receptor, partial [Bacteroidales bacterium]
DVTFQVNGACRLPNTAGAKPERSDPYIYMMAQVTHRFKTVDIYAGCENITNYTQDNPIIDAANPFGSNFDASVVWGPMMSRMFYLGVRWTIPTND